MMDKSCRFLWLEGVFDEASVAAFQSISPASNFWQKGFVRALQGMGHEVSIIGYAVERAWPFGRLLIKSGDVVLLPGAVGRVFGYLNFPYLRPVFQYVGMRRAVQRHLRSGQPLPDYMVVFSCLEKSTHQTAAIRVAKWVKRVFRIPWVCIVADGESPPGADAYVYLPWAYYKSESSRRPEPTIHIDGGVPEVPVQAAQMAPVQGKVLMYMGALTAHGGALELARAFRDVPGRDLSLWFCGWGGNPELDAVARADDRIQIKGFLEEAELNRLASQAFAFANPRPANFAPNKLNYPSKLLHYLAFGKPVISTFTDGVSPEYKNVLIPVVDDSQASLSEAIKSLMLMDESQYKALQVGVVAFNENRSWPAQAGRFVSWLRAAVPRA